MGIPHRTMSHAWLHLFAIGAVVSVLAACETTGTQEATVTTQLPPMQSNPTTVVQAKQQVAPIILTAPDGTTVELAKNMEGSWSSDWDSAWGGSLSLNSQSGSGSSFKGKIEFGSANASCLGEHPFKGSVVERGQLIITTNLGGECGKVIVKISRDGNKWKGTFKAEFPDDGPVILSPRP